jgi:hypothetical protein
VTLLVANYTTSLSDIYAQGNVSSRQTPLFVKVLNRTSFEQALIVLTTDSFYFLIRVSGNCSAVVKVMPKYFECHSEENVQFGGGLMVAPCKLSLPAPSNFLQFFLLEDSQPEVRQVLPVQSQVFSMGRLSLLAITPFLVLFEVQDQAQLKVRTDSSKLVFDLAMSNLFYQTKTRYYLQRETSLKYFFIVKASIIALFLALLLLMAFSCFRAKKNSVPSDKKPLSSGELELEFKDQ